MGLDCPGFSIFGIFLELCCTLKITQHLHFIGVRGYSFSGKPLWKNFSVHLNVWVGYICILRPGDVESGEGVVDPLSGSEATSSTVKGPAGAPETSFLDRMSFC
jgi:hypothetical protein